jgi:serine/threonine protein kinase
MLTGGSRYLIQELQRSENSLTPKLTDFGFAKQAQEPGEETKSGTVLGTALYMGPEQGAQGSRERLQVLNPASYGRVQAVPMAT